MIYLIRVFSAGHDAGIKVRTKKTIVKSSAAAMRTAKRNSHPLISVNQQGRHYIVGISQCVDIGLIRESSVDMISTSFFEVFVSSQTHLRLP